MGGLLNNLSIKKTKGFTLIELLAVLVVLAIIALIAVPMILNIIEQARKGAAVASARSYIKAVETYTVLSEFKKEKISLKSNNTYSVTTTTTVEDKTYNAMNDLVEIKGSLPIGSEDYIKIDENNQVEEALLTINGYVILIKDDEVISITKGSIISVESITLDKESASIKLGETLQLNAIIAPDNATNKTLKWTSSDESIATVDSNGLVTTLKEGTATIKASSINGKEDTCEIEVYDTITVTRAVLDKGTFKNVTPTYLTNQVDGSDGFMITGIANNPRRYDCIESYPNHLAYLRWDYEVDFTKYNIMSFYAKKNAGNGMSYVIISDGLVNACNGYPNSYYTKLNVSYNNLPTTWTKYTIDLSKVMGKRIVSFIGGYYDSSGSISSSTSFCNIKFE